ncbi:MAG: HEPN domain-containing protein [Proteobacteria bacterium]|nr:HEPN domain-containing protein [Pseudomonadota bacterium]
MSPRKQERLFSKEYAQVLWRIADGDYRTVEVLARASGYRVENAFYLAQQSIEKALKAVLVHRGIAIPMNLMLSANMQRFVATRKAAGLRPPKSCKIFCLKQKLCWIGLKARFNWWRYCQFLRFF